MRDTRILARCESMLLRPPMPTLGASGLSRCSARACPRRLSPPHSHDSASRPSAPLAPAAPRWRNLSGCVGVDSFSNSAHPDTKAHLDPDLSARRPCGKGFRLTVHRSNFFLSRLRRLHRGNAPHSRIACLALFPAAAPPSLSTHASNYPIRAPGADDSAIQPKTTDWRRFFPAAM